MTNVKIAVAQVPSVSGNVNQNIEIHLEAIIKAADLGVSYIVFPELSLTGYEPELAEQLAFSYKDSRLALLVKAALDYRIHIAAGAPLRSAGLPHIGEIIIFPDGGIETYSKMNLHPGEEKYFSAGRDHHFVNLGELKIFNAICADTCNPEHAQRCAELGASVYAAGVLISAGGYDSDTQKLEHYAREFNMLVAMANHNRPTGGWTPIGKSAIWTSSGLIAAEGQSQSALIVAEASPFGWKGDTVEL